MNAASTQARSQIVAGFIAPLLGKVVRSEAFSLPRDIDNHSRILVIDSGDLTELLFFWPIICYLKSRFPGMRVTFLVRQGNSELVRGMHEVSEMITYEPSHFTLASTSYFSLLKRIREKGFTVVFLLGRDFNLARSLLTLFTRARIRIGFSQEHSFPFINCELRQAGQANYEATKARAFLTALGFRGDEALPEWNLPEQDIRWARQMIHFRKPEKGTMLVAVDPGRGKGRHRLVEESFAFLINNLIRRYPCKILVISNNLDKKGIERFKGLIKADLLDLEPKNVKEGLALLSCADLFLSGNTDYFHFGVSMGIPSVGLFTRHDSLNWFPKGKTTVQILQGVKGQKLSLDEFYSKIDTLLHFVSTK